VLEREDKPTSSKPGAPFITSTLQQAASTRLGFGVKKTMMMAQRLYEAGHITYMRTDSTNLSQDALNMVRGYISDNFGKKYLPESANQYASKENSQEAHEAIRPSDVSVLAETLKDMEADAQKLYQLIWRQFVACQMTPAQYDSTTLTVAAGDFKLKARGRTLRFDGWTKVMPALRKGDEDRTLPVVKQGDRLSLVELTPAQHFKAAGALQRSFAGQRAGKTRYRPSVHLRVDHLDHSGSRLRAGGKPSFLRGENGRNRHRSAGRKLPRSDELRLHRADGRSSRPGGQPPGRVERGAEPLLRRFYHPAGDGEKDPEEGGMQPNPMVLTSIDCPTCGRKMGIRTASTGVFLGCSGYALPPKERCKTTINLVPENEVLNVLEGDDAETNALRAKRRCQKCGRRWTATLSILSVSCTSVVITRPATAMRLKRASSASRAMTARWWSARSAVLKCT
jgi:DNA topoisomerase-1